MNFNSSILPDASFDFAKIFDNEDLTQDLVDYSAADVEPSPIAVPSAPLPVAPTATAPSSVSTTTTQNNATNDNPFVNILMVVDPVTNKVVCPQQVISYVAPNGQVEKTVFGPITLDSVANLTAQAAAAQVQAQQDALAAAATPQVVSPNPYFKPVETAVAPAAAVPGRVSPSESSVGSNSDSSSSSSSSSGSSVNTSNAKAELPPLRALSAYNFFFRDERDRILNGGEQEFTSDKETALLQAHWNTDRTKKRRHRKTHGKISFTTLSKLISQRWKELSADEKDFFRQVASKDWERYQKELAVYKKSQETSVHTPPSLPGAPLIGSAFQAVVG